MTSLSGEMYMLFGKLSSSYRQIQKIVFASNFVFSLFSTYGKDNALPLLLQGTWQNSMFYFSCILGHTEETICYRTGYCCIENF